ncbi:hypothetical protein UAY_02840 [Enterococcus moraviensis ATCC BAA-383]|uniref:Integral membrane protein n=1 Tax=Enterococcus moraviensis ATCC BAA-383 TaxID=1158609 RepID=R2QIP8_9ENTE|nr:hypothetical protein [Enterococcus moraviensis]EOH96472.1 hypothetical protein UAY_02840 [Enterococcus moraviensis ATCC BAA-383]EOT65898.1 hypothetical protein I586_02167 [Enterococcus moraviensis ATCC BAA-383]OJG68331.1 hypothetical protein RV09_GL001578 [Enterococcus moraviensis]
MKKILSSLFFYTLSGIGISLTLKADIGVSSFNSLNVAIASISEIKVGTITILMNTLFLILFIFLSKQKQYSKYLFMFLSVLCLGSIINFFSYTLLAPVNIENYFLKLALFILGTCVAGFATGMVISLDVLPFPIESVCIVLSKSTGYSFAKFRYGIDLFSVTVSLLLSMIYNLQIFVREGTLISLFLLSGVISFTKINFEPYLPNQKVAK